MPKTVIRETTFDIGGETYTAQLMPDELAENPRENRVTVGTLCLPEINHLEDETAPTVNRPRDFWRRLAQFGAARKYHAHRKKIEADIEQRTTEALAGEDGPAWDKTASLSEEKEERITSRAKDLARDNFVILPVYKYEHGNVAFSTEPFQSSWDSGQVGWIYVSPEVARDKLFPDDQDPSEEEVREKARKVLSSEIEVFSTWVAGETVGYDVTGPDGKSVDSCWGFFDEDYALEEAKERTRSIVT